jgi:hypothetical protein
MGDGNLSPCENPSSSQVMLDCHCALIELVNEIASVEAIENAAQHVLHCAQLVADDSNQPKFLFHPADINYHKTIGGVLNAGPSPLGANTQGWGVGGVVSEKALDSLLLAYSKLLQCGNRANFRTLADIEDLSTGLMNAFVTGSHQVKTHAAFLLSQLAIAGRKTSVRMATMPGITNACFRALSSCENAASETLALDTALFVNNLAALGGHEAAEAISADGQLIKELGHWLEHSNDADTLQRLTGIFNHLSRSVASASALQMHGIRDLLHHLAERQDVTGNADAWIACIGLAHMAQGNIAVCQQHTVPELHKTDRSAIQIIMGFLQCALANRPFHGISFRVYDVLYALNSLAKSHQRELIGLQCGLVDVAVKITCDWQPARKALANDCSADLLMSGSVYMSEEAPKHIADRIQILELSTDILRHLSQSEACRVRMTQQRLETILSRLILVEERGLVREHALQVSGNCACAHACPW